MEFLVILLIIIAVVHWLQTRRRLRELDQRIDALSRFVAIRTAPPPVPQVQARQSAPVENAPSFVPAPLHAPASDVPAETVPRFNPLPRPAPASEESGAPDWEAVIGGNWLNKLGVFVLVIGMALALGYSFQYLGPAGRVGISAVASIAMIVTGIVFERRDRYRIFGRGLIGGGWAALYFTTYAMYAVDAARVIYNPAAAALLLLAVAVGMIVQSLRYRSEAVTGLAYFIAFVTLAITDVTALSVVALAPLAASLLYVSRRFEWSRFAVLGLIATYLTCALRGDTGSALWQAQSIFAIYWLLFEAFDILSGCVWLLPLNAVGFVGLSLVKWGTAAPDQIWQFLAAAAVAYLVSAALRMRTGRWHGALLVASALAAFAIIFKLDDHWGAVALLTEAELIYLAGLRLRLPFLRYVAGGVFVLEFCILMRLEAGSAWTSVTALTAAIFYLNRFLCSADIVYGYAGAGLLAILGNRHAPNGDRGLAWILLAPVPFVIGWVRGLLDFRFQAYLLGMLGLLGMIVGWPERPLSLGIGAAVFFAGGLLGSRPDRFLATESEALRYAGSFIGAGLVAALLHRQVSGSMLTVAWGAEGLALLLAGFPLRDRIVRISGLALLLICILKLFLYDLSSLETLPRILSFIGLGLILVGVSWLYTRFRERIQRYL